MPRSVPHDFDGVLSGMQLRVWERRSERSLHAIAEGQFVHRCGASNEHPVEIHSRWDIPESAMQWHELALRARNHDSEAARALTQGMIADAIRDEWVDPCGASGP